jgi:hypothetical protein
MRFIIDRFEGEFAVVELDDKTMVDIPRVALPAEAMEGDIINITIKEDETQEKRKKMKDKLNELFNK